MTTFMDDPKARHLVTRLPRKTDQVATSFADDIARYMGADADTTPMKFDWAVGTRAQHERRYEGAKAQLAKMLEERPRERNETPKAWVHRICHKSVRHEELSLLQMIGRLHAIIERMKDEEELEKRRDADVERAKHERKLADLRKNATPDRAEVNQLVATIKSARDSEDFLSKVFAAFNEHNRAQRARQRLGVIFGGVQVARMELQAYRETVTTKVMKRPEVGDAPEGAVEFAKLLSRVIDLNRPRN